MALLFDNSSLLVVYYI